MNFTYPRGEEMKSVDEKEALIELRARGKSFEVIAKELGISKSTAIKWSRELQFEIQNSTSLAVDSVREQYKLYKVHKVESLGLLLKRVREELDKRDLSSIPTEKLFDLVMKLGDALEDKALECVLQEEDNGLDLKMPTTHHKWTA